MTDVLQISSATEATRNFSWDALWGLFDGDQDQLNIAHECVDRHPRDAVACRIAHAEGGGVEQLTFGELSDQTSRFANYLERQGVEAGEAVGILMEPSGAFYTALFGTIKRGAVAVPLYTLFGPEAVRERVEDCGARFVVAPPEASELLDAAGVGQLVYSAELEDALAQEVPQYTPATIPRDRAVLQYTSGTTRQFPEAVVHDHRSVVTLMRAALFALGLRPGDRYFCPSHPAWGHGMWHGTIAPLTLGISIGAYAGRFSVDELLDALVELEVENLAAASTVYRMMLADGGAARLTKLRKASYTGEELDADSQRAFHEQVRIPVCGMYGTTETGVIVVNFPGYPDHEPRPGALGKPMPGCEVAVINDEGEPLGPGVPGEIAVRRRGSWFRSKDLGELDEDGFLHYGGRADDVIIASGWTISPLEVERTLGTHPEVRESAVIGVPDPTRGQVVAAYVITDREPGDDFVRELQDLVRSQLAQHEYPRVVEFVDDLPRTPNGKIDRRTLRDQAIAEDG